MTPRQIVMRTVTIITLATAAPAAAVQQYPWTDDVDSSETLSARIAAPAGYQRVEAAESSFAAWLRGLPLRADSARVRLYDGSLRDDQSVQHAVVALDIGTKDLQQCADIAIRLYAEYLYAYQRIDDIAFMFTSGDTASYRQWIDGWRPSVNGNTVTWRQTATADSSYDGFRRYLDTVFMYAGSYSLERDLPRRQGPAAAMPGDLYIDGGFPGHVVILLDVAVHTETGERIALLAQGFTPAQDVHVLTNPVDDRLSPWYRCNFGSRLVTPDWKFYPGDLHYFE